MSACQLFHRSTETRAPQDRETRYRALANDAGPANPADWHATGPRRRSRAYLADLPRLAPRLGLTLICLLVAGGAFAANYEFLALENVYGDPADIAVINPFAIVLRSSRRRFGELSQGTRGALRNQFVYQTRVEVRGQVFYRLAVGNFADATAAKSALQKLKPWFKDAWIYQRENSERQALRAVARDVKPVAEPETPQSAPRVDEDLTAQAKQAFLDQDYARVLRITDRILLHGDSDEVRIALELAGIAHERQGNYPEAARLYETLLETGPSPAVANRITSRLQGIRTMSEAPKTPLADGADTAAKREWQARGAFQQYYRNDTLDWSDEGSDTINELLATDIDLHLRGSTDRNTLSIRLDGGLVRDFGDERSEARVARAGIAWANDDFSIAAGRQDDSATGIFGRFDGITLTDFSHAGYQFTYVAGYQVQSSFDDPQTDNPFLAAKVDVHPLAWLDASLYLVQREISDLTDRRAVGSEIQIRSQRGFFYGIVDYDTFYARLNNIQFISSYRYSDRLTLNLNLGRANSPPLATINALQGQAADSIDELRETFEPDEIYQLAEDRTSRRDSLFLGTIYSIDDRRQLYIDISAFDTESTPASGGVAAIPGYEDLLISADYSVSGFFSASDHTIIGLRLSDTTTSKTESLRLRSNFPGAGGFSYTPGIRLARRHDTADGADRYLLNPVMKLRYRPRERLSFEADLAIEYSELDLPDHDRQTVYSFYLGYAYVF